MQFNHRRGASSAASLLIALVLAAAIAVALLFGVSSKSTTILVPPPVRIPATVNDGSSTPDAVKAPDHFPLAINSAYNGFIGENWKRDNHDDDGIPADGRVQVPGVVPRANFQFVMPDEPNAIQLAAGTPVTISVPKNQRGKYGRLAVLSGAASGTPTVRVMLHYESGADTTDELRVQDWNRRDEATEVFVHKALKAGRVQLFSQIVKLDTARVLDSVTLKSDASAVIFSMTVIVSADRPFNGGM